jgi:hypothetical protein
MPLMVKLEHIDEVAVVEDAVRAEEKQSFLLVYGKSDIIVAKFTLSEVRHWWTTSTKKPEAF